MSYRLSKAAEADLAAIYWMGADEFGVDRADRYTAGLIKALEFIGDFPEALRLRPEIGDAIRVHRFGSHVILFEAIGGCAHVLRIRHGREDWSGQPL